MKANERFSVGQKVRFGAADTGFMVGTIKEITCGCHQPRLEPTALVEVADGGARFITPQSMITPLPAHAVSQNCSHIEER